MKIHLKIATVLLMICASVSFLRAEIDAIPSVGFLSRMSDTIIVGTATLTSTSDTESVIRLTVSRVVTGVGVLAGSVISVTLQPKTSQCKIDPATQPVTAIWFLKSLPDEKITFADSPKSQSCHPFDNDYVVSGSPLPQKWRYSDQDRASDKLAYELAGAFEAQSGNGPSSFVMNPRILHGLSRKTGLNIYTKLSANQDPNVKMVGTVGLIELGDLKALQYLNANLNILRTTPRRQSFTRNNKQVEITYGSSKSYTYSIGIANAVAEIRSADNLVVTELGTLLNNSTDNLIRYGVAEALQNIHTASAVKYLAPLLDSNDPQFRALAIGGIACFANALPIIDPNGKDGGFDLATVGPFKTEDTLQHFAFGTMTISKRESYYLTYWREWWLNNAANVESKLNGQAFRNSLERPSLKGTLQKRTAGY